MPRTPPAGRASSLKLPPSATCRLLDASGVRYLQTSLRGVVMDATECAAAFLGADRIALIGEPLATLVSPTERGTFTRRLRTADRRASVQRWEQAFITRHGGRRVCHVCAARLTGNPDQLGLCLLETDHDSADERDPLEARPARHASRWPKSVGASIAHELRAPLNAITSYLYLLESPGTDPALHRLAVETIRRNAARQTRLIGDLAEWFRLNDQRVRLRRAPTDLRPLPARAIDDARLTGAAVDASIAMDDEPVLVNGDEPLLTDMFRHLIVTAQGTARLVVGVRVFAQDAKARVEIAAGTGSEPGARRGLRTPRPTTIGLALACAIVRLHGGAVRMLRGARGGTSYFVELPTADPDALAGASHDIRQAG